MKPQSWTRNQIDLVQGAIDAQLLGVEPSAAINYCLERVAEGSFQGSEQALDTLMHCLKALELNATELSMTSAQVKKVVDLASALLATNGIKPTTSKLSFLYGLMHRHLAAAVEARGQTWDAIWQAQVGQLTSRKAPVVEQGAFALESAVKAARLGQTELALEMLALAEDQGLDSPGLVQGELLRARMLGRRGQFGEARLICNRLKQRLDEPPTELIWLESWLESLEAKSPDAIIRLLRRRQGLEFSAACWLQAWLWARATAAPDAMRRLPTLRTIRDRPQFRGSFVGAVGSLATIAQKLDQMYDGERPLEYRLQLGAAVLSEVKQLPSFEIELLVLAALFRWTLRHNQMETAAFVLEEYRLLSLRGSVQHASDLLGVAENLSSQKILARYHPEQEEELTGPIAKTPVAKRAFADLVKAVTKLGALSLRSRLTIALSGKDQKEQLMVQNKREIAQILFDFATRTGGVSLKIGQMLSYMEGPVDEAIVEQFELLQHQAPTMPAAEAAKIFQQAFGQSPDEAFAFFDSEPFAAGTIGQVHKARLKTGELVAVKIRYPGIAERIDLDFKRAALLKRFILNLVPNLNFDEMIEEARTIVMAETDFCNERDNLVWYANAYRDEQDLVIPKVYNEFCCDRVLTTEFIAGVSLQDFLFGASEEEKTKAATTIARASLHGSFRHGVLLADPHPGNYLFRDGKVCLIDFGCVKRYSSGYFHDVNEMTRAFFQGKKTDFHRLFVKVGMAPSVDSLTAEEAYAVFASVKRTSLKDEPYLVTNRVIRDIFNGYTKDNPHRHAAGLPTDMLFSARIEFGLYALVARFGVPLNWYRLHCDALGIPGRNDANLQETG